MKIAFFDAKSYDMDFFNRANADFGFKITYFSSHLTIETAALSKGHDTICIFVNDIVTQEIVDILIANQIRLIALRASGYNNIDLKAVYRRIHVVRVPAYSPHAVAEHAVALMLSLNRKIHKAYYRTHDGNFNIQGLLGFDMVGKTAGVIGTGQIGKIVAQILKGFGMRVLGYDLFPDKASATRIGFEYVDLDTLWKESDILTLHCPLTKETVHLINEASIAKMKPGVMIINTGRGMLIDSKALIEGLKSGQVGSAGLDVYEEENEYFFEDFSTSVITDDVLARLLSFNNVLVTSHQGFFTKEALQNIAAITLKNIKIFFLEERTESEICYKCGQQGGCVRKQTGKCF
ncbi:MAG: 2-hydroxyacid dehydrogenase [Candidatus Omnitrophica bacterium]|nr:2-hydroxyacid dehydrogenase [Candidatus Omnitrophota bacterium]